MVQGRKKEKGKRDKRDKKGDGRGRKMKIPRRELDEDF